MGNFGCPVVHASQGTRASCAATHCDAATRSEEHTSELQSLRQLVCRLLLEKKNGKGSRIARARSTGPSLPPHGPFGPTAPTPWAYPSYALTAETGMLAPLTAAGRPERAERP